MGQKPSGKEGAEYTTDVINYEKYNRDDPHKKEGVIESPVETPPDPDKDIEKSSSILEKERKQDKMKDAKEKYDSMRRDARVKVNEGGLNFTDFFKKKRSKEEVPVSVNEPSRRDNHGSWKETSDNWQWKTSGDW